MITFPNAKINLGLNIVEKRADGYHNLETIFFPIPLRDALEITPSSGKSTSVNLAGIEIEDDPENNLVMKAFRLIEKDFNLPPIDIFLEKIIPFGAGLGGGSADASCMLLLLNKQFSLGIPEDKLLAYAAKLGADCPFFIKNRPMYATGIGDVLEEVDLSLEGYHFALVKPNIFVSTKEAYSKVKPCKPEQNLRDVIKRPVEEWKNLMVNDFEKSVFEAHPRIGDIKETLYDRGAVYASMSGSGSSVFGLFKKHDDGLNERFRSEYVFQCKL
ncbi:MAG: 4-(cytidine 5'-diphospho)-2-C-methyl-D-erythritol kinase [Paludibacteraceae bacterium]|jgi:4-diphosphocytidyl-2-C-methyl-D-erythritol kinase|nr:4-(cytidine 5'-diphospho)-2-C-methyl-D-erythritol kinase [Paludibacteraceae bacterium]MBO5988757.1 4-(cytidine 5'-diphospho)-2-C-methyl-D-erythritol kinase [Paludibacteraceae bacterium]MBQ1970214.1 4-(cytidine 5'-diphospho)-2-C-methyl-D-erythritol kinase [Paludibacteraceae bacterium]MEE0996067.1 4-(cytidine 5'-diphospho)-2-C-methyl-D-erythritol kinase [Paludibacteraceae bacterium]MEE1542521.1 4-(cytidine 5'-diphospho)-2-C-methyl-D-erythritol kinase [Paludibacteraceae bacterium]